MSHAPLDSAEDPSSGRTASFTAANLRQRELLRNGVSNSGHERNCCFLNTGGTRFANVSAVAGLDHIGDGRAYALVDWDHDGDLDLWATNRTGPRVQFLRNDSGPAHRSLSLELQGNGTTTNRDAIGARVTVWLKGDDRPLIKTLRAGEGFLSQSSKRIHVGLGQDGQIDRVEVRWPNGAPERFTGLEPGGSYRLVQGQGHGELLSRRSDATPLDPSVSSAPEQTGNKRI